MSKEYLEALEILCGELVEMDLLFTDRNGENQNKWLKSEAFAKLKEFDKKYGSPVTVLQNALKRLESIDNAEPSEALKCLDKIAKQIELDEDTDYWEIRNAHKTVENALIKAQKEHNSLNLLMQELECKDFAELRKCARCGYEKLNKKYLKWEDLEFEKKQQVMDVLLNGKPYILYFYKLSTQNEVTIFSIDMHIVTLSSNYPEDVQLFNDLHLERVE